jgi:glycosyltransferase involved in cell wall biosynthesis
LIGYAIESVLSQDSANWKLVIIDNCSNDTTSDVCNRYQEIYENITFHHFDELVPIHQNWERGLQFVDTDYFITLSDDDHLASTFVSDVTSQLSQTHPDILLVNRATYAPQDDNSLIKHKLILSHAHLYSSIPENIFGKDIWLPYLTCEVVKPKPYLCLHPSMFIYSSHYVKQLCDQYGVFYKPAAPDYYASIVASLNTDNIVFINRPLVCIGGLIRAPYCFANNKFKWFGMIFNSEIYEKAPNELRFLVLAMKLFDNYPYFIPGILKQSLMTINDIGSHSPRKAQILKDSLVKYQFQIFNKLFIECINSHNECQHHGDPIDPFIASLSSLWGQEETTNIKSFAIKTITSLIKPFTKYYYFSLFLSIIYNLLSDTKWIPLRHPSPSYAAKTLSMFVISNKLSRME